jgi:hypothetical protein
MLLANPFYRFLNCCRLSAKLENAFTSLGHGHEALADPFSFIVSIIALQPSPQVMARFVYRIHDLI